MYQLIEGPELLIIQLDEAVGLPPCIAQRRIVSGVHMEDYGGRRKEGRTVSCERVRIGRGVRQLPLGT